MYRFYTLFIASFSPFLMSVSYGKTDTCIKSLDYKYVRKRGK